MFAYNHYFKRRCEHYVKLSLGKVAIKQLARNEENISTNDSHKTFVGVHTVTQILDHTQKTSKQIETQSTIKQNKTFLIHTIIQLPTD